MPQIHCTRRKKEATCLKDPDVCAWDGSKCFSKEEQKHSSMANRHCACGHTTASASRKEDRFHVHVKLHENSEDRMEPYDPKYKSLTNVHMGQRKLMLSEIQFLTKYYKTRKTDPVVVYIGAAPGNHLPALHAMFPNVTFILYDGATFDARLKRQPGVFELHQGTDGFFDDAKCAELKERLALSTPSRNGKKKPLLFISDIRLGSPDKLKFEKGIGRDMDLQYGWVKELCPRLSMLKFRMPYTMKHGETMSYLDGTLFYGIWPKQTSGETRLVVEGKNVTKPDAEYDFKTYEETMFYHNKNVRSACHKKVPAHMVKYTQGENNPYCTCYDCMAEMRVLDEYAKLMDLEFDDVVAEFALQMNKEKRLAFQRG